MRPQATRSNPTLRALSLSVLLVPVLFLALFAAWSYREHYREAEGRMVRTLDLLQEHGSKVFETYDLLASYTDELLSGLSDDDVSAKEADLNERLRRYTEKLPQVQDVWVISASGRALVTANVFPVPRQIDFSDRGYFQALRDTDTNLYISEVLRGRVQNVTFFQFARRRPGADGSFNGVVAVSVQPNYFRDYYSRVAANGLTSGALQREDGFVLARFPALPANLEATRVNTAFLQARERNPERGLYTVTSAFDGVVRLIAYQRVPGYPIYVSVGLTSSVVRDAWLRAMIWPFALVLPAALALFGLTRLAISQSIRERIAVDRAAEEALRRERAEVEQRRADALHRAYYDNTSEAQFVIGVHRDGRFTIEDRNPAHAAAFSFDLDKMRGQDVRDVLPPDLADEITRHYRTCVEEDRPIRFEMEFGLGETRRRWETVLAPVHDETGCITHLIGASRDLTERVRLEQTLRESQKTEALSRLVSGVAHDFNNILQVVAGNIDLLKRAPEDRRPRLIENAARAAEQGRKITSQLLAFGRRQALKPEVLDLNALLSDMDDMLAQTLRGDIRLELDLAGGLWPVEVDVSQLQVALINVAANARDAMPQGGTLLVRTENTVLRDGEAVEGIALSLTDSGAGMPPEVLARVGEPFFSTKKESGQGNGLGLAQVLGFVQQSGGSVDIRSEVGRGTTVTLRLPRSTQARSSDERLSHADPAKVPSLSVLLVEDNPQVADLGVMLLTEQRHRVILASNADEALQRLRDGLRVDLVVSDLVMPGEIDGLGLAQAVRAQWPGVPVLLVSGYSDRASRAQECGFVLLSKPFSPEALNAHIADLFASRGPGNVVPLRSP